MMDGTSESSTRSPGSSTEVCDRVFGEYTRDTPLPKNSAQMGSHIAHPWDYWFEGDRPDWYLPWPEMPYGR